MDILHIKDVFRDSDFMVKFSEEAGFKPAPCITKLEDVKDNDYKNYHKPDKKFFNAEKVFFWEGKPEFSKIKDLCLKTIDDALSIYFKQQSVPEWEGYEIHYFSTIKYEVGGFFALHQDTLYQPDDLMKSFTIVVYMSDFEGGELIFPQHELTLKPEKGDIVVFPAGANYKHVSDFITKGTKYCMTLWPLVRRQIELTK